MTGPVECAVCGHEWISVRPCPLMTGLQCPACRQYAGEAKQGQERTRPPFVRKDDTLRCLNCVEFEAAMFEAGTLQIYCGAAVCGFRPARGCHNTFDIRAKNAESVRQDVAEVERVLAVDQEGGK